MANAKSWYSIKGAASKKAAAEIVLYDEIGMWGVSAADFRRDLKALGDLTGKPLDLRISTPGGDVFAGATILTLLVDSGANITVYIDGLAASMGSYIAMVGKPVIMAANAMMMIHNPASHVSGTAKEMKRQASLLDSVATGMMKQYQAKSGLDEATITAMMDDETWMTAEEAVIQGFADSVGPEVGVTAKWDLTKFKHTPMTALAKLSTAAPAATTTTEDSMDKTEFTAALAASNEALLAGIGGAIAAALKPQAPAAGDAPAETAAQIEARVNKERDDYESEVTALCGLAGFPAKAAEFISAKLKVPDVRAKLQDFKNATGNLNGNGLNNHQTRPDGSVKSDTSDLVATSINSGDVWARRKSIGGAQARHVIKRETA